jgi:hypothetical protein
MPGDQPFFLFQINAAFRAFRRAPRLSDRGQAPGIIGRLFKRVPGRGNDIPGNALVRNRVDFP